MVEIFKPQKPTSVSNKGHCVESWLLNIYRHAYRCVETHWLWLEEKQTKVGSQGLSVYMCIFCRTLRNHFWFSVMNRAREMNYVNHIHFNLECRCLDRPTLCEGVGGTREVMVKRKAGYLTRGRRIWFCNKKT